MYWIRFYLRSRVQQSSRWFLFWTPRIQIVGYGSNRTIFAGSLARHFFRYFLLTFLLLITCIWYLTQLRCYFHVCFARHPQYFQHSSYNNNLNVFSLLKSIALTPFRNIAWCSDFEYRKPVKFSWMWWLFSNLIFFKVVIVIINRCV